MLEKEMVLYNHYPTIDLHGLDRDSARIFVNDFIRDNYLLRNYNLLIIHGIGQGILKKSVHDTLQKNKCVESFKLDNFNSGCTIVKLIPKEVNK